MSDLVRVCPQCEDEMVRYRGITKADAERSRDLFQRAPDRFVGRCTNPYCHRKLRMNEFQWIVREGKKRGKTGEKVS